MQKASKRASLLASFFKLIFINQYLQRGRDYLAPLGDRVWGAKTQAQQRRTSCGFLFSSCSPEQARLAVGS